MKISIITVSYNSKSTIRDTIDSVLSQDHKDIEYIVIDGASTDGTVDIIRSYKDRIFKCIAEKDNGIYDAMNKGIRFASGDIVGMLNSDDVYLDKNTISTVVKEFETKKVDSVYGGLVHWGIVLFWVILVEKT